jgi:predicted membrane channel-forming protein YqfA (hemolysin III family)
MTTKFDLKRAAIAGVIFYAVIFLIISAMMFTPLWGTETQTLLNILVGGVVAYLVASMYYFKKKPKEPVQEGLYLGLVFAAVSIIIEIPVMVYGFASQMGWAWFAQWNLFAGYVFGILACIFAAKMKK